MGDMFFGSINDDNTQTSTDNSIVFVKWPYLKEAKVVAVSDTITRLEKISSKSVGCK